MFTKSLIVSVALGTVGLAGMCSYLWNRSKRTSACIKKTNDLKVAKYYERSKIINILSSGTWGPAGENKNSTSMKTWLDCFDIKANKNTRELLRDSAHRIPNLANVKYYAVNPVKERQPEIFKPETRNFNDPDCSTTIPIMLCLKDIQNIMLPLNLNPSVRSFTIDHRKHTNYDVLSWQFPSVHELINTTKCSIIPPRINNVIRYLAVYYKLNFRENTLTMFVPKGINFLSIYDPRPDADIPPTTIERRSDRALKNIKKSLKTSSIGKVEYTTIIVRKADIPPEIKKLMNPVAMLNQLIPYIKYNYSHISKSPAINRTTAKIFEQIFEADAPTIQEAKMNVCIDALEVLYNYEHPRD